MLLHNSFARLILMRFISFGERTPKKFIFDTLKFNYIVGGAPGFLKSIT
jgi:hypothetical protein